MLKDKELQVWRQSLWFLFYTYSFLEERSDELTADHGVRVLRRTDFYDSISALVKLVGQELTSHFPNGDAAVAREILSSLNSDDVLCQLWTVLVSKEEELQHTAPRNQRSQGTTHAIYSASHKDTMRHGNDKQHDLLNSPTTGIGWNVFSTVLLNYLKDAVRLQTINPGHGNVCLVKHSTPTSSTRPFHVDPLKRVHKFDTSPMNSSNLTVWMSSVTESNTSDNDEACAEKFTRSINQELSLMLKTEQIQIEGYSLLGPIEAQHQNEKNFQHNTPRAAAWSRLPLDFTAPTTSTSSSLSLSECSDSAVKDSTDYLLQNVLTSTHAETNRRQFKPVETKRPLRNILSGSTRKRAIVGSNSGGSSLLSLAMFEECAAGSTIVVNMQNIEVGGETDSVSIEDKTFTRPIESARPAQAGDCTPGRLPYTAISVAASAIQSRHLHGEGSSIFGLVDPSVLCQDQQPSLDCHKLKRRWSYPLLQRSLLVNTVSNGLKDAVLLRALNEIGPYNSMLDARPKYFVPSKSSARVPLQEQDVSTGLFSSQPRSSTVLVNDESRDGGLCDESKTTNRQTTLNDRAIEAAVFSSHTQCQRTLVFACGLAVHPHTLDNGVSGCEHDNHSINDNSHMLVEASQGRMSRSEEHSALGRKTTYLSSSSQLPSSFLMMDQANKPHGAERFKLNAAHASAERICHKQEWVRTPHTMYDAGDECLFPLIQIAHQQTEACGGFPKKTPLMDNFGSTARHPGEVFNIDCASKGAVEKNENVVILSGANKLITQSKVTPGTMPPPQLSKRARRRISLYSVNPSGHPTKVRHTPPQIPLTRYNSHVPFE